jgi:exopolyphosphatase/guanosine-5'-triphosphate,3'-diphosphate pyrophosphatase
LQVVAIDLGSNTLRVLKWDCRGSRRVAEFEEIVKTAENLEKSGKISNKAVARVIDGLKKAKEQIDFQGCEVVAVTTEALRRATNSKEVLETIFQASGVRFEVITGEKEALFTLLAVVNRLESLKIDAKDMVLVDIGGGSTEITFRYGEKILSKSFPVGIVTTAQKYQTLARIKKGLESEMRDFENFIDQSSQKPKIFVATAGTPTTIASIKLNLDYQSYDPEKINGTELTLEDLDMTLQRLLELSQEERAKLVGVGREDLIVAGVLIFRRVFEILGFEKAVVVDDGLREGVAINFCRKKSLV